MNVIWCNTDTAKFNWLYNHLEDSFHWKTLLLQHWSVEARLASQFRYTHSHESTQLDNTLTCFSTVYGIGTGDKRNSVDEKTCSLTKNPLKFNRTHYKNHHVLYSLYIYVLYMYYTAKHVGKWRDRRREKHCQISQRNGGGGGVMFEYVIFLHFDLRGINFFKFETLH